MLLLENVQKTFNAGTVNEKKALTGVNLNMNSKDFVTVIGGNGAGKSTMLNMIAGVYSIDKGKGDGFEISIKDETGLYCSWNYVIFYSGISLLFNQYG